MPERVDLLQRLASLMAVGRFHREWNSTMMSILSPTAFLILRKGSRARVELGAGDVVPARRLGGMVEGPDLHAGDALLQQRVGELVGTVEEGVEVLVGPGVCCPGPSSRLLQTGVADVLVARTGIVGADALARAPAQELDHGLVGGLAPEVLERDVDRRGRPRLHARAAEAQIAVELLGDLIDRERVLAQDAGGHDLVQERLDRGCAPMKVSPRP